MVSNRKEEYISKQLPFHWGRPLFPLDPSLTPLLAIPMRREQTLKNVVLQRNCILKLPLQLIGERININ